MTRHYSFRDQFLNLYMNREKMLAHTEAMEPAMDHFASWFSQPSGRGLIQNWKAALMDIADHTKGFLRKSALHLAQDQDNSDYGFHFCEESLAGKLP